MKSKNGDIRICASRRSSGVRAGGLWQRLAARYSISYGGVYKSMIAAAILGLVPVSTRAQQLTQSYNGGFANGSTVPDGNLTGWWDTETITSQPGSTISNVNISISLAGGSTGDLFIYVVHDGTLAVLANRPGVTAGNPFGYSDSSLNVVFSDAGADDFHNYQSVPGYSITGGAVWQPDGRDISPLSAASVFDTTPRQNSGQALSLFDGESVDGTWTIFIADTVSGGGDEQVQNWGLNVTETPEPGTISLLVIGLTGVLLGRRKR